jgi:predicted phage terminase large subunit-like protein
MAEAQKRIELTVPQGEIFMHPARWKCVIAGRRFGKSYLANTWLLDSALTSKDLLCYYVAPTYRQVKEIAWAMLKRLLPLSHVTAVNESELSVTFTNESRIKLKGADNYDCYDDQTEILTSRGWMFMKDLPEGLPVMTLNPGTNKAELQKPLRYIHEEYGGPMYQLTSKKLDLLVTPNHKFLVDTRKGVRKFKQITKIAHQDRIPASAGWEGQDNPKYTTDIMAFLGFYLSEGCARKDPGPKKSYEITFAQTKGTKGGLKGDVRGKFVEVLNRLNVNYREQEDAIRVYEKKWWELTHKLGRAWEKRIPRDIMLLPPDKLKTLLHWMIAGDGVVKKDGMRLLYTTSLGLAGDVQELCMKIGQSAGIAEKPQTSGSLKCGRLIEPKRPLYTVSIYRNKHICFRDTKENYINEVPKFIGNIHCVEVPNHTIYVRRNGKATWSGNSLRGVGIDRLVLDEFADIAEEAWNEVLRPAMADRQGHGLFIGTPKGYNWAKRLYDKAQNDPDWATWHFSSEEGGWIPPKELEAIRAEIGAVMFSQEHMAQFVDLASNIFRRDWWQYYREEPATHGCIQSWDTAFKKGSENDYSVCTTWGLTKNAYVLLDMWRGQVEFPELKRQVQALYAKHKPYAVIVEDKASGQSLIQELQKETVMPVFPVKVDSDKITRANAATPIIEAGKVMLPNEAPWLFDFIEEMTAFPAGEHDDIVDSVVHGLNYLRWSAIGAPEKRYIKPLADIMIDAIEKAPEPAYADLTYRDQIESDRFWEGEERQRDAIFDIR